MTADTERPKRTVVEGPTEWLADVREAFLRAGWANVSSSNGGADGRIEADDPFGNMHFFAAAHGYYPVADE